MNNSNLTPSIYNLFNQKRDNSNAWQTLSQTIAWRVANNLFVFNGTREICACAWGVYMWQFVMSVSLMWASSKATITKITKRGEMHGEYKNKHGDQTHSYGTIVYGSSQLVSIVRIVSQFKLYLFIRWNTTQFNYYYYQVKYTDFCVCVLSRTTQFNEIVSFKH